MTIFKGKFTDVARETLRGTVQVYAVATRRGTADNTEVVTRQVYQDVLRDGVFTTPELDPGPVIVELRGSGVFEKWQVVLPATGTHELAELLEEVYEYTPEVVAAAQTAARDADSKLSAVVVQVEQAKKYAGAALQAKDKAETAAHEAAQARSMSNSHMGATESAKKAAERAKTAAEEFAGKAETKASEAEAAASKAEKASEQINAKKFTIADIEGLLPLVLEQSSDIVKLQNVLPSSQPVANLWLGARSQLMTFRDGQGLHCILTGGRVGEVFTGDDLSTAAAVAAADMDRVAYRLAGALYIPLTSTSSKIINPYMLVDTSEGRLLTLTVKAAHVESGGESDPVHGFFTIPID